ncbi:MAG: hypothetical protein ACRKGH_05845 [Dehalogenimonas sp.]
MWNNYLSLLAIAALLRADYEMRKPPEETSPPVVSGSGVNTLASRQDLWARKAVKRYAEAQDKKWRNWNQAMFEKSE